MKHDNDQYLLFDLYHRCSELYDVTSCKMSKDSRNVIQRDALRRKWYHYLRHGEGYVFIVVRCSVCLSVCLSVSNITKKRLNGFSWNLQGRWDLIQGTIRNIFRMFHSTPWTQDFPPLFRSNPCLLAALQKKRLNGFSWNFLEKTDMTQGAIRNTFGMLRLTPWILGRFIYFLDPCLFVMSWKNEWTDFHEILWNFRHDTRNN